MSGKAYPPSRFLVRQGSKGWMVYDRHRKGPAMVGTDPAVDLTRERANNIKHMLTQREYNPVRDDSEPSLKNEVPSREKGVRQTARRPPR